MDTLLEPQTVPLQRRPVRLLRRRPSMDLLRRPWAQWLVLIGGPLLVSGVVWIVNIMTGTAFARGCGIGVVLVDAADSSGLLSAAARLLPLLDSIKAPTSTCQSVPFSADLPSMVLSVTAGLALSVYVLLGIRLRLLKSELLKSGLLSAQSLQRSGLGDALAANRPRHRGLELAGNVVLAVVSTIGSAGMYFWLYTHGPIFRDLAGSYRNMGSSGVTTEQLRGNWWANHTTHPVNTGLGIAVGAIGLFIALKQGNVFLGIARLLLRLRRMGRPVDFVPKWLDRDFGWRPVNGLVTMGYLATFAFLASFSAALYALRSDQPGLSRGLSILLAVIATVAALANGFFLVSLITTIRTLFTDAVDFERKRILTALRGTGLPTTRRRVRAIDRLSLLTEGANLADVPNYPISGRWLRFAGVVPAFLGALWTFGNEVGRAFGL